MSIHINPSEFGEFVMKSALFEGIKLDTQIGGFMSCNKKKVCIYTYMHTNICSQFGKKNWCTFADIVRLSCFCCCFFFSATS